MAVALYYMNLCESGVNFIPLWSDDQYENKCISYSFKTLLMLCLTKKNSLQYIFFVFDVSHYADNYRKI